MILGTAGHIDHGKTALVRALTGVDTDRLPEEKRRGITIDLGFAPLRLDDGRVLGVVDVPGHEAFVRTMLAGASGIDVGLLVIAADEGPMPQTREHLAILGLLHVPRLVVALSKADLVDPDWLALVTDDVRELLAPTPYAPAQIVAVSALTGQGVAELRELLAKIAAVRRDTGAESDRQDLFRLPIDRVFTMKGTGTVVTGTVWTGQLSVEDTVRVLPGDRSARVRGLQMHGAAVKRVGPGHRVAVALAGMDVHELERGATLVTHATWGDSLILRADATLQPDAPELRPRTRVRFHLGTAEVGARVIAAGAPVSPGDTRAVRVVLDEPVAARTGDRFVLRSATPLATIGGGQVTDSHAPRRARPMPRVGMDAAARFELLAREAVTRGLPHAELPVRLGVAPGRMAALAAGTRGLTRVADSWYHEETLAEARARLLALVRDHLAQHPLSTGASRSEVQSRLHLDGALFDALVEALARNGQLAASGAELHPPGWAPALSGQQQHSTDDLLATLEAASVEPPSVGELQTRFGAQTLTLLRHLERSGRLVQVEDTRFYASAAVRLLLERLEAAMAGKGELAPTDIRAALGLSRKFLIPFLEYCDKRGYTLRQGSARIWRART